jgi:heptosyltransferase-2
MKNILVVNVNWLGDVIFSIPIFKAIKKRYPDAKVACLAVPRVKDVLEHCPYIDEIIIYDEKNKHFTPWGKSKLISRLRKRKFDAAFLLHRSMTRAMLIYLAGIPVRIGFENAKQNRFLTHRIPMDSGILHRSDEYLRLIEGFGVAVTDRVCQLDVSSQMLEAVNLKLLHANVEKNDSLIVINPGGNWDLKRWPPEFFSELIQKISKEYRWKVLISGGQGDLALANQIAFESQANPIVWAGQTTLAELMALYNRADLIISNDSGPSHVASSVGTDVIALFGPTRPEITAPRGAGKVQVLFKEMGCNKAPCYHLSCTHNQCMRSITVDDVFHVIKQRSH